MTFTLTIRCDNAAFEPDPPVEVARILFKLGHALAGGPTETEGTLRDVNGNRVGEFAFTPED